MTPGARFLHISANAAGNWPPQLELVRSLVDRGHTVSVISDAFHEQSVREAGAEYFPYQFAPQRDNTVRLANQGAVESQSMMREVVLNEAYSAELLAGVKHCKPDVILVDQALPMAAAAAESTGLPFATLWHTLVVAWPSRSTAIPPAINALRTRLGLKESVGSGLERLEAPYTKIAFTYRDLDEPPPVTVPNFHYVGPLLRAAPASAFPLPWPGDDPRDLVLVSLSTSYQDQVETLQRIADAVGDLPLRVLMTLGDAISSGELRLPANVTAAQFIPHAAVLPRARLVITHAGHGTMIAAATYGVPQLCLPMGRDQHVNGAAVLRTGIGRVASMSASSEELRAVIVSMLGDEALLASARAFAAQQDVEGGRELAVRVLEGMA